MTGRTTRRGLLALVCVAVLAVPLLAAAGCSTQGKTGSAAKVVLCPKCGGQTHLVSVEGLEYKTCFCPDCGKEYGEIWDGYRSLNAEVHFCDNCKAVVEKCANCRAN